MSEWISVKDRLPEDDLLVLITDGLSLGDYEIARWNGSYWTRKAWPLGYEPTHWMPLPEPPKAD